MRNEHLQQYALRFVGVSYIWGGDDPMRGFDCSGLAQELLLAFGAHPHPGRDYTAQGLYDHFAKAGQYNATEIGALAFYGKDYRTITHVGIVVFPDLILEAGGGGSRTKTNADAIEQNAYVRLRPLKARRDLVTCILPKYP